MVGRIAQGCSDSDPCALRDQRRWRAAYGIFRAVRATRPECGSYSEHGFSRARDQCGQIWPLSDRYGRVDVSWKIDRSTDVTTIDISWIESNGPEVHAPRRRGFGSRLIEQGIARE